MSGGPRTVSRGEQERWTTQRLLAWTTEYFARRGVDPPRLSAEMLLAHVLGVTRLKLYTDPQRPATELERAAFRELVERAVRHEPVDYLVGRCPFFSMMLRVDNRVLIPRPSTETIVEHVIQHARRTPGFGLPLIGDVGTGSGAIAIALARNIPNSRVIATDVRADALDLARENAAEQGVADRIEFRLGDLLEPLTGERLRYLVSNPPYISDREWQDVEPNVKDYEPMHALRGGADGLDFVRPIVMGAHKVMDSPSQLLVEVAASHKQAVLELAEQAPGLEHARVLADHEGLPRVLVAEKG